MMKTYIKNLIREINELENVKITKLGESTLSFEIESFTDNTQIIFEDLIKYLLQGPNPNEFIFLKSSTKAFKIYETTIGDLISYNRQILLKFLNLAPPEIDIEQIINMIDQFNFDNFNISYFRIFQNIKSIRFLIAGNIDKSLVEIIHNNIKGSFEINSEINLMQTNLKEIKQNPSVVINY